jgi:hypothetical protein
MTHKQKQQQQLVGMETLIARGGISQVLSQVININLKYICVFLIS